MTAAKDGAAVHDAALVVDGLTTGYLKAPVMRNVSLLIVVVRSRSEKFGRPIPLE